MLFIERLQNKPRYIRVQVLWISVILIMAIIIFIWAIYLKAQLSQSVRQKTSQENQSAPSLFKTIKEDFSFLKNNLQAEINGLIKGENENKFEVEIVKPSKLPEP